MLRNIKAATGVDLTMPVKGNRLKKTQYINLTDIKAKANTPRSRLEKKVLVGIKLISGKLNYCLSVCHIDAFFGSNRD